MLSVKVKAKATEKEAWEQVKALKQRADIEKRRGVLKADTIADVNRAYTVLRTLQINNRKVN